MKATLLFVVMLGAALPATAHIDIMAALHKGIPEHKKFDILSLLHGGHKKKKEQDPTGVLSQIMAAAGQGLALAEQHHEVAVQSARVELQVLLTKQGDALVQAIEQYNNTLVGKLTSLNQTRDTSNAVVAKAEKEATGDSWDSKSGHAQATLKAQVSFVEREIKKAERKHKASMRQAISEANLLLEGGVQKLSRKVGDISDMVKKTQDDVEANATVTPVQSPASFMQKKVGINMDCAKAVAALKADTQNMDAAFAAGLKTMTAAFGKVEQELASGAKAISDKLAASQEEELRGVRSAAGGATFPAPPKSALRSPKKHS